MDSLLKRIGGRRDGVGEPGPEPDSDGPPGETTAVAPAPAPAGLAPDEPAPDSRRRGQLRRRLRHLRQLRDPVLRDLGGFVYEIHRSADLMDTQERELGTEALEGKLARLSELDAERARLESELGDARPVAIIRQPGVRECPACGAYAATSARFCSACGGDLTASEATARATPDAPAAAGDRPAIEAGPTNVDAPPSA